MSLELAAAVDMNGSNAVQPAQGNAPIASLPSGHSMLRQKLQDAMLVGMVRRAEYLYLIASDQIDLYKIGYSEDPIRRCRELQATSAFPLRVHATHVVPYGCGRVFEEIIHRAFADRRTHGEWFRLTLDEVAFLEEQQPFSIFLDKCLLMDDA